MVDEDLRSDVTINLSVGELFISDPTIWNIYDLLVRDLSHIAEKRFYRGDQMMIDIKNLISLCESTEVGILSLKDQLYCLLKKASKEEQLELPKKRISLDQHSELKHVAINQKIQKDIL